MDQDECVGVRYEWNSTYEEESVRARRMTRRQIDCQGASRFEVSLVRRKLGRNQWGRHSQTVTSTPVIELNGKKTLYNIYLSK